MTLLSKLSVAAASLVLSYGSASALTTVDFSDLSGNANYSPVPDGFGSGDHVSVSYRTLNPDLSEYVPYVEFWNGGYSGDDAAFAVYSGATFEVKLDADAGFNLSQLDLFFGGYPNVNKDITFSLLDGLGNLIDDGSLSISGATGAMLAYGLAVDTVIFRFGTDWNAGLQSFDFDTAAISAVPIPAALPLMATGLGMIGWIARRRHKATAA